MPRHSSQHGLDDCYAEGMRLLLIGNYPLERAGSMDRYAAMLARELRARGHIVEIERPAVRAGGLYAKGALGKWLGYFDRYVLFPVRLRRLAQAWDAVHICDHSNSVYLRSVPPDRASITCHDAIAMDAAAGLFPEAQVGRCVGWTGRIQQRWIRRNLLSARRIVAVSHATAERLRSLGAEGEIRVIHNPMHRRFVPAQEAAVAAVRQHLKLGERERYLLHVGGNHWYKNRLGVLRIFHALRKREDFQEMQLVMAGPPWTEAMLSYSREAGLDCWVHDACEIGDGALEALYTGAEALLFPSFVEGFGWPVVEAQSCGALVVTSDRAVLREIAGGGAIFIDPESPENAARTMEAAWAQRETIRLEGVQNARQYSSRELMDAYEAVLADMCAAKEPVLA